MARADFTQALRDLQDELLELGDLAQQAVLRAVDALKQHDLDACRQVVEGDDLIDERRNELEEEVIHLIATQQPAAGDLRALLAILHCSVELERMADYGEGIAKIGLAMGEEPPLKPLVDIPRMAEKATDMVRRGLEALVHRDKALAEQVSRDDSEIDDLYDQVYRELLVFMIGDPSTIQRATYLLWVAHNLERVADRATNIAERVVFLVTGKLVELNAGEQG